MITVFKTMDSHGTPEYFEIDEVLGRIKRGINKQLIDQIRGEKDKAKRDLLKKKLLWICFSGEFSERLNDKLKKHSGFICLDFDGMNQTELKYWRQKIKANKHTYCVFTSPSGNGLKAIWRIPECETNEEHNRRFEAIAWQWKECKFFDLNVKGVNRVCFESYDPELIINHNAEVFEDINDEVEIVNKQKYVEVTDETEEIFKRIVSWFEKSHNLNKGNRDKGAFVFASGVAEYLPKHTGYDLAINYILRNVEQAPGDQFTLPEIEKCVKHAYDRHPFPTKSFDLQNKKPETKKSVNRTIAIEDFEELEFDPTPEEDEEVERFWYYNSKGALKLSFHDIKKYLEKMGFFRYEFIPEKVNFIRVESNIISNVTAIDIKNFLLAKLEQWGEIDVFNLVAEYSKFKDEYLSLLSVLEPKFIEDTKDEAWFFFKNTAVKVTGEAIEEIPYIDIEGCIWKSSKLDRDFKLSNADNSDFSKFLWKVSKNDTNRVRSLCSSIGYMLHRFKAASNAKGVIYYDEQINEQPAGGTGKTLIFQALGYLREVVILDAKSYDDNNQFALQRLNPSTNVLIFDDPTRKFKFENLFSKMSTGLPINKKNKPEIFVPFKKSPKFGFASNYIMKGETSSFNRRKFEIEIHPFYSDKHQPIDDFGVEFWSEEWTNENWNDFFSLMLNCCKLFINSGLIVPEYVNLADKKIMAQTSAEFIEWAQENILNNNRYHRNETYQNFKRAMEADKAYCPNAHIFYSWIRSYADYKNWDVNDAVGAGRMYIDFGKFGQKEIEDDWMRN